MSQTPDNASNALPVVDVETVELKDQWQQGERFGGAASRLAELWQLRHLGCRVVEIPPGRRGWPFHNHYANDELFYVVSGHGELRYGDQQHAVCAGQLVGCPAGGAESAHQLINTGDEPLRYLAISSMREPEIAYYPDSDKWGLLAGSAPGSNDPRNLTEIVANAIPADYWQDEK
ncbi:MAG: cupin domain-containing protein [Wenzhouxiangellaceae bacterium]